MLFNKHVFGVNRFLLIHIPSSLLQYQGNHHLEKVENIFRNYYQEYQLENLII